MPEEQNKQPESEAALIEQVEKLSLRVKETEDLRKRLHLTSLAGILLMILVLMLFFVRITGHFRMYYDAMMEPGKRALMVSELLEESQAREILTAEAQEFHRQMMELVPVVREQFLASLEDSIPQLEEQAMDMGHRLMAHTRNSVEKKLVDAMVLGLLEVEVELQHIFPNISMDDVQTRMDEAKAEFVSQLHDLLEEKLATVTASVATLQATALELADDAEIKGVSRDDVEAKFIDVLLELIAYELTPKLGQEAIR